MTRVTDKLESFNVTLMFLNNGNSFRMVLEWGLISSCCILKYASASAPNTSTSFRLKLWSSGGIFSLALMFLQGWLFIQPPLVVWKVQSLCYYTDPHCTQAYKHGPGSQHCPPYRQEPKVPPVEMSLFPPRLPHNERDSLESAEGTANEGLRSFHT